MRSYLCCPLVLGVLAAALLWAVPALAQEIAQADRHGRIDAMDLHGEPVEISTNFWLPTPAWRSMLTLDRLRDAKAWEEGAVRHWSGRLELDGGTSCLYEQALTEADGAVRVTVTLTPQADAKTEGAHFELAVPIAMFAGGRCEVVSSVPASGPAAAAAPPAGPGSAALPRERPEKGHLLVATGDRLAFADAPGKLRLDVALGRPCTVTIQDTRVWKSTTFEALVKFSDGQLTAGKAVSLQATLKLTGPADTTPAHLTVDASKVRYRLDGFGGNYCFNIESPVTQYTLANLRVAWARTEMRLDLWEPVNDNDSPTETNWDYFAQRDREGSRTRAEMLMAQQIQKKGIPYVISIWKMPEWMFSDPGKGLEAGGRKIAPDKWDEVLESIGSYLVYAKKRYGVEPDLFSFNEPDYGVQVKLSPVEHRDAIKRLGAHFEKLGLKTRMLLADVAQPRGSHIYAQPTVDDPQAMKYVGAVAMHSWGGASPQEYQAWGDLAEKLKLPLLVSELGVDAGVWRTGAYNSYPYAVREAAMYQELILYARPRGTMQWEFTGDYSLLRRGRGAGADGGGGGDALEPTSRFWMVKQFCNLTPPQADVLATSSDHPRVLLTAFAGQARAGDAPGAVKKAFVLHVVNTGGPREAVIAGLPANVAALRPIRTSREESFKALDPVPVRKGSASIQLAGQSMLTLTAE